MSRPIIPAFTVRTWATNEDYPAGVDDWSGNPTKVEPPSYLNGFIPDQGRAAEYDNKLFYDAFTAIGNAKTALVDWTTYLGQIQAFNWRPVSAEIVDAKRIAWDSSARRLVSVGGSNVIKQSTDGGATWSAAITTGVTSAGNLLEVMADEAGNLAIIGSSGKTLDFIGGTWTYHASGLGFSPVNPKGVWAPSDNLFCLIDRDAGGTAYIYTSPTGATWTSRTVPSNFAPSTADIFRIAYGNGRIVIVCRTASSTVKTAYSDDGGATWTNGANIAVAFDPNEGQSIGLVYSAALAKWILTCSRGDVTGADDSAIYTSTDGGSTWTLGASLTTVNLREIACLGGILLATWNKIDAFSVDASKGFLAYSLDGLAWKHCGQLATAGLVAAVKQIVATPNRFVILGPSSTPANAYCYSSFAAGEGSTLA